MSEGLLPNLVSNPTPVSGLLSLESCSTVATLSGFGSPVVWNLWQLFGCRIHLSEGEGGATPPSCQKGRRVCRLVSSSCFMTGVSLNK